MSDKESTFIKWISVIVGSLIVTVILGSFTFYKVTTTNQAVQEEKNRTTEIRMDKQDQKVETMRIEWREDQKETKASIDLIVNGLNQGQSYRRN